MRDNGGHAVALSWTLENIYDVGPGDVMWTASDVGWVVGHSYIVYGPLLAGATTVLYEGKPVGTPDAGAFWRVIQDHKVNVLFTAPTALRAIRKADPEAKLLETVRHLQPAHPVRGRRAAGHRHLPLGLADPGRPGGGPLVADRDRLGHLRQPARAGRRCPSRPARPVCRCPASSCSILDGAGEEVEAGTEGNIVLGLPLPPGTLTTLWGNDERYISSYLQAFEGCYATGDSGYRDEDGYLFVMGRTDDIINVAGHRLSTGAMEQVIGQHPAVAECAVIGLADPLKGQRPSGYVVLKSGVDVPEEILVKDLIALVRRDIGAVADFKHVTVVEALPKTRSGKILRKTMRQIADGDDYVVPSTIEDAGVIDQLIGTLRPGQEGPSRGVAHGWLSSPRKPRSTLQRRPKPALRDAFRVIPPGERPGRDHGSLPDPAAPAVLVLRPARRAVAGRPGHRAGVGEVLEVAPGRHPGHAQCIHHLAGGHGPGLLLHEVLHRVQRGRGQALGQRQFGGRPQAREGLVHVALGRAGPGLPAPGRSSCSRN